MHPCAKSGCPSPDGLGRVCGQRNKETERHTFCVVVRYEIFVLLVPQHKGLTGQIFHILLLSYLPLSVGLFPPLRYMIIWRFAALKSFLLTKRSPFQQNLIL